MRILLKVFLEFFAQTIIWVKREILGDFSAYYVC